MSNSNLIQIPARDDRLQDCVAIDLPDTTMNEDQDARVSKVTTVSQEFQSHDISIDSKIDNFTTGEESVVEGRQLDSNCIVAPEISSQISKYDEDIEDDDEFGDFRTAQAGSFNNISNPTTSIEQSHSSSAIYTNVIDNAEEANRIRDMIDIPWHSDVLSELLKEIESCYPIDTLPVYIPCPNKLFKNSDSKLLQLDDAYTNTSWGTQFIEFQNESIYNTEGVRWKESKTRQLFRESLAAIVSNDQKVADNLEILRVEEIQNDIIHNDHINSLKVPAESKDQQLLNARELCGISENEIKHRSSLEIRELITRLNNTLSQVQIQANDWLDAKEKLVMDAEMHNKMIASLVTYAQQQQTKPVAKKR